MMRMRAALSISAALGFIGTAEAQEPYYAPPEPTSLLYDWSGPYVGLGGGYAHQSAEVWGVELQGSDWFGSVWGGANFQAMPNLVIGFEVDGNSNNFDDAYWSARARVGTPVLSDTSLLFISGGYSGLESGGEHFDGWAAGFGLDTAIPAVPGLILRTEFLYMQHDVYGVTVDSYGSRLGVMFKF